jgi:hypothetical protein
MGPILLRQARSYRVLRPSGLGGSPDRTVSWAQPVSNGKPARAALPEAVSDALNGEPVGVQQPDGLRASTQYLLPHRRRFLGLGASARAMPHWHRRRSHHIP